MTKRSAQKESPDNAGKTRQASKSAGPKSAAGKAKSKVKGPSKPKASSTRKPSSKTTKSSESSKAASRAKQKSTRSAIKDGGSKKRPKRAAAQSIPEGIAKTVDLMGQAAAAAAESGQNQMALDLMDQMAREINKHLTTAVEQTPAGQALHAMPPLPTVPGAANLPDWPALELDPGAFSQLQQDYISRATELIQSGPQNVQPKDRRFQADAWRDGLFGWNAALYELNAEFMARMAQAYSGDPKAVERVRFATQQWIDATAPSNFLVSNPEAQKQLVESGGQSLVAGLENLMADMQRGRISQTDESAFEVGRDLAVTPGAVVYQNELFQLIQYTPTTEEVWKTPMVMVPPCINKFYILDLQRQNSVVAHLVDQGHTVFMVSWKNPKAPLGHITWDDYLSTGVIEALNVTREICDVEQVNTLGFCVGGTILSTTLAALAARGEKPARSVTLLTTLLDFEDPGVLNIFIDEAMVSMREATVGQGGIMPGADLAQTFSALRPNDLIWNYVVKNYLHGQAPPAFDLLYWNSDSTNLPGPMFAWYLRHMYLQNDLCQPGKLKCLGESIDLGSIDTPTYLYGSRDDHIVPWKAAYSSTALLTNDVRFVLGASGHIAGVINAPAKNKRNYWINDATPPEPDDWFDGAAEIPGSWWPDWYHWLEAYQDGSVPAREPGDAGFKVIEAAPGSYVKEKAV